MAQDAVNEVAVNRAVAIVLAAGRGTRMGGPKALLLIEGKPLLLRHVDRFLEAGCSEVVVVAHEEFATRLLSAHDRVRVVVSHEPEPRGSLAIGARAALPSPRFLVTPVDALPASVATLEALLAALDHADAATPEARAPSGARGGHPIACRAEVLLPYLKNDMAAAPTLRDRLASLGPRRVRVAVDDVAVAVDLDTPEDVVRLTGAPPVFWS